MIFKGFIELYFDGRNSRVFLPKFAQILKFNEKITHIKRRYSKYYFNKPCKIRVNGNY